MNHEKILEGVSEGREDIVTGYVVIVKGMGADASGVRIEVMDGTGLSDALGMIAFADVCIRQDVWELPDQGPDD